MTALLDANVLIALVVSEHVHHDAAAEWLSASGTAFATCPITQGSLVRFLLRSGQSAAAARDVVAGVENAHRHEFWSDSVSFADVAFSGVVGHRQVTDAYLAQLARSRNGRLATLDSALAHQHSDVAVLIPAR
ncbi:VapC toxin family PIN domain ribonuclease [Mycobacterium heckeshornense]|uniref:Ribonuclease VapC n=1 Tax=Mycobacterium heckeshornense TaxID=110505 RepID=A0A2G8BIY3_9MYCO|nr:TA system VapC family ribonuclease toxin [Mycobacterium heckeshornense]KMV23764.1 ribonuclease [Mycobacterium heckeshornense]MCV7033605.1 PIN domain-containing protein [Mycobacterium heckeshornense]PIJ37747.1 VapC toxin family PIN domain ribonuclease [Mycobacterium heckeshornense]BCO37662.1 ribonuclease VapC [Mycobacterium heckeshornense]